MSKSEEEEPVQLTEESFCTIHSLGDRNNMIVTKGIFKGYSRFGMGEALSIELDDSYGELAGKIRLIPSHVILSIDLLEIAEEKDKEQESHPTGYYG